MIFIPCTSTIVPEADKAVVNETKGRDFVIAHLALGKSAESEWRLVGAPDGDDEDAETSTPAPYVLADPQAVCQE